jgi:hypothetical protein
MSLSSVPLICSALWGVWEAPHASVIAVRRPIFAKWIWVRRILNHTVKRSFIHGLFHT